MKDDLLLSTPHPLYPDIISDPAIPHFSYENSYRDVSGNPEGEIFCFSSTPLYDSEDHEDIDANIEFYDYGVMIVYSFI